MKKIILSIAFVSLKVYSQSTKALFSSHNLRAIIQLEMEDAKKLYESLEVNFNEENYLKTKEVNFLTKHKDLIFSLKCSQNTLDTSYRCSLGVLQDSKAQEYNRYPLSIIMSKLEYAQVNLISSAQLLDPVFNLQSKFKHTIIDKYKSEVFISRDKKLKITKYYNPQARNSFHKFSIIYEGKPSIK